jgi:hypothetical protein
MRSLGLGCDSGDGMNDSISETTLPTLLKCFPNVRELMLRAMQGATSLCPYLSLSVSRGACWLWSTRSAFWSQVCRR